MALVLSAARMVVMERSPPHDRDNEKAYVTVNGKTCWTETFTSKQGSKQCGSSSNNWFEDSRTVKCEAESVSGKLAVRVYTSLSSNADDESFAIDNVVVSKLSINGTVVCLGSICCFSWNCVNAAV